MRCKLKLNEVLMKRYVSHTQRERERERERERVNAIIYSQSIQLSSPRLPSHPSQHQGLTFSSLIIWFHLWHTLLPDVTRSNNGTRWKISCHTSLGSSAQSGGSTTPICSSASTSERNDSARVENTDISSGKISETGKTLRFRKTYTWYKRYVGAVSVVFYNFGYVDYIQVHAYIQGLYSIGVWAIYP